MLPRQLVILTEIGVLEDLFRNIEDSEKARGDLTRGNLTSEKRIRRDDTIRRIPTWVDLAVLAENGGCGSRFGGGF